MKKNTSFVQPACFLLSMILITSHCSCDENGLWPDDLPESFYSLTDAWFITGAFVGTTAGICFIPVIIGYDNLDKLGCPGEFALLTSLIVVSGGFGKLIKYLAIYPESTINTSPEPHE